MNSKPRVGVAIFLIAAATLPAAFAFADSGSSTSTLSAAQELLQLLQSPAPAPTPAPAKTTASAANTSPSVTVPVGVSISTHITLGANLMPENSIIPAGLATTTPDTPTTSAASSTASLIQSLYAELKVLEAQIAALLAAAPSTPAGGSTPTTSTCTPLTLTQSLSFGSKGTEVSALQDFLQNEGYYTYPAITGYFGPVTEQAVETFQSAHNIVSSGTPTTTGYGAVGPKTKAEIAALTSACGSVVTRITPTSSTTMATSSTATTTPEVIAPIIGGFGGGGGGGGGGGSVPDTSPPILSAIASTTGASTSTVTWTTNENASSKVVWGATTAYGSASSTASLVTSHSISLSGLSSATTYHFAVVSIDGVGNSATSSDQTFVTAASTSAPVISDISYSLPASQAVAVDTTNAEVQGNGIAGTSFSNNFSLSTKAGDNGLVVALFFEANPGIITPPTWNGVSMTQIGSTYNDAANDIYVATFGLLAPGIGAHFVLAASWANNVFYNYAFVPLTSLSQTSFATSFINYSETGNSPPNPNTGTNISTGGSVKITDNSANPTSNLNMAIIGDAGGAVTLASGQTNMGGQPGNNDVWDVAYGAGKSSDTYTFTGTIARNWAMQGITAAASAASSTTATITWTTDQLSNSKVVYGTTTSYGSASSSVALVTSHSIGLTGLATSTTYHYEVVSTNGGGQTSTSTDQTFATEDAAPVISGISSGSPGSSTSTITWTTDKNSNSEVVYGTTNSYGLASSTVSLVTSHSLSLSGLSSATVYHYAVVSADNLGTTATSTDQTFTTASSGDVTPPSAPTNLSAVATSSSEIDLSWTASTDNVGVAGYKIFRGGVAVGTTTSGTTFANTGLTASTTYTYTVAAYDAAGNVSSFSGTAIATTTSWNDGFAAAPSGTAQFSTVLQSYTARAPWHVAGVDYAVGITPGTTLKDPLTGTLPSGVSRDTTNHIFTVTGNNVTLNGWDFSLENGWMIIPDAGISGLTISNSNFELGSNRNPFIWPQGDVTDGMTVINNVFNGNAVPVNFTTSSSSLSGTNVLYLTNTTGIVVGMAVGDITTANAVSTSNNSGSNETRVQSIVPNTSVTLTTNTIGTVKSGDTVSFLWTNIDDVPIIAGIADSATITVQYNLFKNVEGEDWQQSPGSGGGQLNMSYNVFQGKRCCDHTSAVGSSGRHRSGDQAARRTLVCSAQAHGRSSSSFWAGQPLTSLARISAR